MDDSKSFHSHNMYQIFDYVKNRDTKGTGNVAGMLLYAKTNEVVTPDALFSTGGGCIYVKTLDLNCEFTEIKKQLDMLVSNL